MQARAYHFEIKDLVTGFISAFDNIIIKRYDVNRQPVNNVQVRYVYAPKQRVLYDLVNKAQNITLPVVSVSIGSVNRNVDRVFNKKEGLLLSSTPSQYSRIRMPVPVDITMNVSIIAKYQSDMDQILSNFIPYNNPYIIISWKIPAEFNTTETFEIRSEVLWSGSVNLTYPTDLNATEKYRVSADTSFTVKGWLFPAAGDYAKTIYEVIDNHYAVSDITTYAQLSGDTFTYPVSSGVVNELESFIISAP